MSLELACTQLKLKLKPQRCQKDGVKIPWCHLHSPRRSAASGAPPAKASRARAL